MIKRAAAKPGRLAEFGNTNRVVSLLGEQDGRLFPDAFIFLCRFQIPVLSSPLLPPGVSDSLRTSRADLTNGI